MEKYTFNGKILIIGFGSIGQGVLPLLLRHFSVPPERIIVVTADKRGEKIAREFGAQFIVNPITRDNYKAVIDSFIGRGDFLLNVSVDVSSVALIKHCQRNGILYLDTVIEPWPGFYTDSKLSISGRSNYALREEARGLRAMRDVKGPRPTAVLAHGANPGLVSHFVKEALLNIARDTGLKIAPPPASRERWARLAEKLGVKVIHIAERDTQASKRPKKEGEFVNTWSIDGFFSEGTQPSEMGWGTHEQKLPKGGKEHKFGPGSAIYLEQPSFMTKVRSWTPIAQAQHAWVITHHEAISLADYLTIKEGGKAIYRPTVHYAYHPCDGAVLSLHELAGNNGILQESQRLISKDIAPNGVDELGVLLMGHAKNAYWYGSRLSIDETRRLAPYNNATGLQVVAGILGAMVWAIKNPNAGIVDSEEMDHNVVMEVARPYLGEMLGVYTDWTPLQDRGRLFPEKINKVDVWQFENFRVS